MPKKIEEGYKNRYLLKLLINFIENGNIANIWVPALKMIKIKFRKTVKHDGTDIISLKCKENLYRYTTFLWPVVHFLIHKGI